MLSAALLLSQGIGESRAVTTNPTVNRIFYFSSSHSLTTTHPASANPSLTNFAGKPVEFDLPNLLLRQTTMNGNLNFSLWIKSNITSTFSLDVTLSVKDLNERWDNGTAPYQLTNRQVRPDPTAYNFGGSVGRTLGLGDHIYVALRASSTPKANITLLWGSASSPSLVVLPLSGYITLANAQSVSILDSSENPTNDFDLNSSIPKIIFQANFFSALGKDISRVNLTVVDSSLRPIRTGTNLEMSQFPLSTDQPFVYTTTWLYPSNATDGVYQVNIDAYDVQNSLAFSYRGPTTFRLSRASIFSKAPFNYLPYFGVGGAVVIGGSLYYRRRKTKKSYLVPFDYFNTLTGGELDGGTVLTVEGNTGSGKTILTEQLMFEDLRNGKPCVFVATSDFPANIRASMKTMGLDVSGYEQNGLLTFVDGYSSEAGQQSTEKFSIPSLGDLTTLGMKISSSLPSESKGGSLYFDSLTPLASKTKPESLVSFVQSVGARVRGMGGKALFTVGPSVDGMVQKQLEEMADCVVQMEAFEEGGVRKSRLRIAKFRARRHQQGWVIYTIEDGKGIIFYSKKPRK